MSTTPCFVGEIEAHGVFFREDHTGQAIVHQGYLLLRLGRFRELFSKNGRNFDYHSLALFPIRDSL
jgi:proteasome assembly chaperone (PAC2) family protein